MKSLVVVCVGCPPAEWVVVNRVIFGSVETGFVSSVVFLSVDAVVVSGG